MASLEECLASNRQIGSWRISGFAHKVMAVVLIAQGRLSEAATHINMANTFFETWEEGLAHVHRVRGVLLRAQEDYLQARQELDVALNWFTNAQEDAEAARAELEIARLMRDQGFDVAPISETLVTALRRAEKSRHDNLVREIEAELKQVNEVLYLKLIYRRVRGSPVHQDTTSLVFGQHALATVAFMDIERSTEYARSVDPSTLLITLNQMMAASEEVLLRYDAIVTTYLGDGFMLLFLAHDHARRAVSCALDLHTTFTSFNEPRVLLKQTPLRIRIGIGTGEVCLGNVGTYQRMDFTAIGATVNLAARIQTEAEPDLPCVSEATYESVRGDFATLRNDPRIVTLKGFGEVGVWDVADFKPRAQ
jgi:class 3 adenylate cyclase